MASTTSESVAGTVRAEMARHRITQREVAAALHLTTTSVRRRLTGEVPFDVDELETVARLLDMPPRELLPATH